MYAPVVSIQHFMAMSLTWLPRASTTIVIIMSTNMHGQLILAENWATNCSFTSIDAIESIFRNRFLLPRRRVTLAIIVFIFIILSSIESIERTYIY